MIYCYSLVVVIIHFIGVSSIPIHPMIVVKADYVGKQHCKENENLKYTK